MFEKFPSKLDVRWFPLPDFFLNGMGIWKRNSTHDTFKPVEEKTIKTIMRLDLYYTHLSATPPRYTTPDAPRRGAKR